jgi:hypothetical protein
MRGTLLLDERCIHTAAPREKTSGQSENLRHRQRRETVLQLAIRLLMHAGDPD